MVKHSKKLKKKKRKINRDFIIKYMFISFLISILFMGILYWFSSCVLHISLISCLITSIFSALSLFMTSILLTVALGFIQSKPFTKWNIIKLIAPFFIIYMLLLMAGQVIQNDIFDKTQVYKIRLIQEKHKTLTLKKLSEKLQYKGVNIIIEKH